VPLFIALLASVAIAGGFGALVGILVGGRSPQRTADGSEVSSGPVSMRVSLSAKMRDIAPTGYLGMLDRQLAFAGRPPAWTIDKILIAKPVLATVAVLLSVWFISDDPVILRMLLGVFVVIVSFFLPELLIYSRAQERQAKIQEALADTLDQMTIAVEAGLGFESAMAKAATNGKGPLAEEFIRTLQDMSIGRARKAAYEAFSERTSSPDLRRFTRSIIQADAYGLAIADVLRVQAERCVCAGVSVRRRRP